MKDVNDGNHPTLLKNQSSIILDIFNKVSVIGSVPYRSLKLTDMRLIAGLNILELCRGKYHQNFSNIR